MKRTSIFRAAAILAVAMFLAAGTALSCPVCYGSQDSPSTQGVTAAILSLLGVTGGVLTGFGSLFLRIRKRARALGTDQQPGVTHGAQTEDERSHG
jgi:hypothetical protein